MLAGEKPDFLMYMRERWYSCRDMWSDCDRGTIFTATNTTSNRIESGWGQVKRILGLKLRVDMCLEAVFTYATAVLDREIDCIKTMVGPTMLMRSGSDRFMRPVLREVSDYCANLIEEQYEASLRMTDGHFVVPDRESPSCYSVEKYAGGSYREVDTANWSCKCIDFVTTELPCRHIIFVSRVERKDEFLPMEVLRSRWVVRAAIPMLPALIECRDQLQTLRTGLLLLDPAGVVHPRDSSGGGEEDSSADDEAGDDADDDLDLDFMSIDTKHHHPAVAHVRLARGEVAAGVVLDNLEKRNVVQSEIQPLMTYMMAQSSPRFKCMATYLREALDGLLMAFKNIPLTAEDQIEDAISTASQRCSVSLQEEIRGMVESTLESERLLTTQSSKRAEVHRNEQPMYGNADRAVMRPREDPVAEDPGDDNDDVSSLSISCASAILQDAAVRHAEMLEAPPVAAVQHAPLGFRVIGITTVPPATKRSSEDAQLDVSILQNVVMRVRESPAQAKLQKAKSKWKATKRLAYVTQRSDCAIELDEFVEATRATPGIASVASNLRAYPVLFDDVWLQKRPVAVGTEFVTPSHFALNFAIPIGLLKRFEGAITNAKAAQPPPCFVDTNAPPSSDQLVARLQGAQAVRGFTDENVASVRSFYATLTSCEAYAVDLAWVSQHTSDTEDGREARDMVLESLQNSALETRYLLKETNRNPPTSIALHNVLGHLAGEAWLSDAVLVFLLRQVANEIAGFYVFDSIRSTNAKPRLNLPTEQLARSQLVVFPVHVAKSHWCLICVAINADVGVRVTFYDAQAKKSNVEALQIEWRAVCEPVVRD